MLSQFNLCCCCWIDCCWCGYITENLIDFIERQNIVGYKQQTRILADHRHQFHLSSLVFCWCRHYLGSKRIRLRKSNKEGTKTTKINYNYNNNNNRERNNHFRLWIKVNRDPKKKKEKRKGENCIWRNWDWQGESGECLVITLSHWRQNNFDHIETQINGENWCRTSVNSVEFVSKSILTIWKVHLNNTQSSEWRWFHWKPRSRIGLFAIWIFYFIYSLIVRHLPLPGQLSPANLTTLVFVVHLCFGHRNRFSFLLYERISRSNMSRVRQFEFRYRVGPISIYVLCIQALQQPIITIWYVRHRQLKYTKK